MAKQRDEAAAGAAVVEGTDPSGGTCPFCFFPPGHTLGVPFSAGRWSGTGWMVLIGFPLLGRSVGRGAHGGFLSFRDLRVCLSF